LAHGARRDEVWGIIGKTPKGVRLLPQFETRRATPSDAPILKEIAVAAKAHWGYPAKWMAEWANWINVSPTFVEKYEVYKAVEAGHILGWCALLIQGEHAHLEDLWVRPDRIGTGLGRILFEYAANRARVEGPPASILTPTRTRWASTSIWV
jgi:GNAT superfamily N-acetyltransferase